MSNNLRSRDMFSDPKSVLFGIRERTEKWKKTKPSLKDYQYWKALVTLRRETIYKRGSESYYDHLVFGYKECPFFALLRRIKGILNQKWL